jgi:dUTP pyrophosphatase
MILGVDKVLELIKTQNLVEGLDEKDINFEGCGVDLRVGKIYEFEGSEKGFLHIENRKSPNYKLIAEYKESESRKINFEPGKLYRIQTIESVNVPSNIFARFYPRGNLFAAGIIVLGQKAEAGYKGTMQFTFINISKIPFEIEMGARICQVVFHETKGKTYNYKGQWQGGRAFIEKEEKQTKQN